MVVFGQKWLYSDKVDAFRQSGFIRVIMVAFGQSGSIRAKLVVFGLNGCIR